MHLAIEQFKFMTKNEFVLRNNHCELIYVPRDVQPLRFVTPWVEGMTIKTLIQTSGFLNHYPAICDLEVGVFGQIANFHTLVKRGDRVELYRPLLVNPKEKRRQKALSKQKT